MQYINLWNDNVEVFSRNVAIDMFKIALITENNKCYYYYNVI